MIKHLNLVENDYIESEKRILPRFPFTYLTFKSDDKDQDKIFEVHDISLSGMRVSLKDGEHTFKESDKLTGALHWRGKELKFKGHIQWAKESSMGVVFDEEKECIKTFFSSKNIVEEMVPVHLSEVEIPQNLKYWLRTDGPVELFVWKHNEGEVARFLLILFNHFLEWEDGKGLKTGKVVSHEDIDSPLTSEDEFIFEIDSEVSERELQFSREIASFIPEDYLSKYALEFIKLKLG